ncbi:MAG TPA: hypothetical protein VGF25_09150 [Thermoleophilaceae bacterium]|jgi:hypothetical protein
MAASPDRHIPHPVNFMGEASLLSERRKLAEGRDGGRSAEIRRALREQGRRERDAGGRRRFGRRK